MLKNSPSVSLSVSPSVSPSVSLSVSPSVSPSVWRLILFICFTIKAFLYFFFLLLFCYLNPFVWILLFYGFKQQNERIQTKGFKQKLRKYKRVYLAPNFVVFILTCPKVPYFSSNKNTIWNKKSQTTGFHFLFQKAFFSVPSWYPFP